MDYTPTISVLMSIYNESIHDVNRSVESIITQTNSDFEFIIVIDNPNKREYLDLLYEYSKKDKRIVILENEVNIGLAASMNKALTKAKGEYIVRMDADDISVSTRLQKEVDFLRNHNCDVVFTNYIEIGQEDELLHNGEKACGFSSDKSIIEQIVFNGIVHHPTVMMKKESLMHVNGYRIFPCSQDQDLWIRMLEAGARFAFLDEILLYYRIRQDSISQKKGFQQYVTIEYILKLLKERSKRAGEDNYTIDNYNKYISLKLNDAEEIKRFSVATQLLKTAQKEKCILLRWIIRVKVFIISKTLREVFLFKLINRKKLLSYINCCTK